MSIWDALSGNIYHKNELDRQVIVPAMEKLSQLSSWYSGQTGELYKDFVSIPLLTSFGVISVLLDPQKGWCKSHLKNINNKAMEHLQFVLSIRAYRTLAEGDSAIVEECFFSKSSIKEGLAFTLEVSSEDIDKELGGYQNKESRDVAADYLQLWGKVCEVLELDKYALEDSLLFSNIFVRAYSSSLEGLTSAHEGLIKEAYRRYEIRKNAEKESVKLIGGKTINCQNCGRPVVEASSFCIHCGSKLAEEA